MQLVLTSLLLASWSAAAESLSICVPGSVTGSVRERTIETYDPSEVGSGVTLITDCTQLTGPIIYVRVEPSLRNIVKWSNTSDESVSIGYVCAGNVSYNMTTTLPRGVEGMDGQEQWILGALNTPLHNLSLGDECSFFGCYWYEHDGTWVQIDGRWTKTQDRVIAMPLNTTTCTIDYNECVDGTAQCAHDCTDVIGGYYCRCRDGYRLEPDGHNCTDIDECANGAHNCEHTCVNTVGHFNCSCREGFVLSGDNRTCDDIDECVVNKNETVCHQDCVNTIGSYVCKCREGYNFSGDGHTCEDVDECLNETLCDHYCTNTNGSYSCTCGEGYALSSDGHTCEDIDECATGAHNCEHTCVNTAGHFNCSCLEGFVLNGDNHTCDDIDECAVNENEALCHQDCVNTIGSYVCKCQGGYSFSGDGYTCEDVDECLNETFCDHYCTNTNGSYSCTCGEGYALSSDGHTCEDIDECTSGSALCDHNCTNAVGNYTCSCREGYELVGEHDCTDHCAVVECGAHSTCRSVNRETICECDAGYEQRGQSCELKGISHLMWALPVLFLSLSLILMFCAYMLWRKHQRDKYNQQKQYKSFFEYRLRREV